MTKHIYRKTRAELKKQAARHPETAKPISDQEPDFVKPERMVTARDITTETSAGTLRADVCPSCGSDKVVAPHFIVENDTAWQVYDCTACHQRYMVVFEVAAVRYFFGRSLHVPSQD